MMLSSLLAIITFLFGVGQVLYEDTTTGLVWITMAICLSLATAIDELKDEIKKLHG